MWIALTINPHVAFLSVLDNGNCPATHPVGLMKLFYEITWNIHDFAGRWSPSDGWPFVYVGFPLSVVMIPVSDVSFLGSWVRVTWASS